MEKVLISSIPKEIPTNKATSITEEAIYRPLFKGLGNNTLKSNSAAADFMIDNSAFFLINLRYFNYEPINEIPKLRAFFDSKEFETSWGEYLRRLELPQGGLSGAQAANNTTIKDCETEELEKFIAFLDKNINVTKPLPVNHDAGYIAMGKLSPGEKKKALRDNSKAFLKEIAAADLQNCYKTYELLQNEILCLSRFMLHDNYMDCLANAMFTAQITVNKLVRFNEMVEEYNLEWAEAMFDWQADH